MATHLVHERGSRSAPAAFHAMPAGAVLEHLGSCEQGLDNAEVERRRARWGANVLPEPEPPGIHMVFARQFLSPFIYVLLLAAALSAYLREWSDAGFIAGVLVLNAVIGTMQEWRAQRSAQALRSLVTTRARVIREGDVVELDMADLVPGDVVALASGDKVPADLRLLDTRSLLVDESPLTGESLAVEKRAASEVAAAAGVADRVTMAHAGTLVTYGRGRGVVTSTGTATELGQVAQLMTTGTSAEPPLLRRMRQFTYVVAGAVTLVALVVGAIEVSRGTPVHEVLLLATALGVSAIPEGLPVALTVALALGMSRMARRHVVIRRLVAVESLGSCTVIASDKTGTLTVNELTASRIALPGLQPWAVTGVGAIPDGTLVVPGGEDAERLSLAERLAIGAVMCNEATLARVDDGWVTAGDPVDVAALVLAHKLGITRPQVLEARPLLAELAFESERGYAASLHAAGEGSIEIAVKGAVERVLPMCALQSAVTGETAVDPGWAEAAVEAMAAEGYRVIAVATARRPVHSTATALEESALWGLTLVGLIGMVDPVKPDAADVVRKCRQAGITVVMMTGDHAGTALTVARELGIASASSQVVTGAGLQAAIDVGPAAVDALTRHARVFARIEPAQKLAIVESLTRQGQVVAVTGDGANDAPALRAAHVGVAMGRRGTDVAREAAELVVTDDDFSSIVAGVEEGRIAYANVRKVIQLLVSTGAGELVLFLAAVAAGLNAPLLAVQLLWLNLVTNGIQDVALAFEPGEGDEMSRRPRAPGERVFNRVMVERVLISAAVMGVTTFLAYRWMLGLGWTTAEARNSVVLLMVLFENVHVFNSRSELRSVFRVPLRRNLLLVAGTALAQGAHVAAMHLPWTQELLDLQPVSFTHWLAMLGLALLLLVAVEAHKGVRRFLCGGTGAAATSEPSRDAA